MWLLFILVIPNNVNSKNTLLHIPAYLFHFKQSHFTYLKSIFLTFLLYFFYSIFLFFFLNLFYVKTYLAIIFNSYIIPTFSIFLLYFFLFWFLCTETPKQHHFDVKVNQLQLLKCKNVQFFFALCHRKPNKCVFLTAG